jgi:hypothetical protein
LLKIWPQLSFAGMKGHRSAVRFEVVIPADKMELLRAVAGQAGLSVNATIRLAINRLLADGEVKLPVLTARQSKPQSVGPTP